LNRRPKTPHTASTNYINAIEVAQTTIISSIIVISKKSSTQSIFFITFLFSEGKRPIVVFSPDEGISLVPPEFFDKLIRQLKVEIIVHFKYF